MKMTDEEKRVLAEKQKAAAAMRLRVESRLAEEVLYSRAWEEELHPKINFDGMLRPAILMSREHHRLLRAVAAKRAQKVPGEQPSIGRNSGRTDRAVTGRA